jgi:heat shock protein HslJ
LSEDAEDAKDPEDPGKPDRNLWRVSSVSHSGGFDRRPGVRSGHHGAKGNHQMRSNRRRFLGLTLAAAGAASPIAGLGAPLAQFSGGIPPFVWSLTSFPGVGAIAEPARYTVQFAADGNVYVGADCNRAAGVWSGGGGAIDVSVTLSTLALCPEDSIGNAFVQALDAVTSYTVSGGALTLHGAAGDMTFTA